MSRQHVIRLFGRPSLVMNDTVIRLTDRVALFLALLYCAPNKTLGRAEIAEHLWPDKSTSRVNMRQFLNRFQKSRSPLVTSIDVSSDQVSLNTAAHECDLFTFQEAAASNARNDAINALSLIEGTLLEGIRDLSPVAEDWLREQRGIIGEQALELSEAALSDFRRFGQVKAQHSVSINRALRALRIEKNPLAVKIAEARQQQVGLPTNDVYIQGARPRLAFYKPEISEMRKNAMPIDRFVTEIADRLSIYRTFVVLACHSTFKLGQSETESNLKDNLRPDYSAHPSLVNGRHGAVLRLQMVRESDSSIFWAAEFELNSHKIARTGSHIIRHIAATLSNALETELMERASIEVKASAFLNFLTGRNAQNGSDLPSVRRARNHFAQSVRIDPTFSNARARLAETFVAEWLLRGGNDGELLRQAKQEAEMALNVDRGAAIAHWVSGGIALYQRDYDYVLQAFETAETLSPNSADLLLDYADALSHLGEETKAEVTFGRALNLNPSPPDRYWWFGASIALSLDQFDIAAQRCGQIKSPEVGIGMRATSYALSGDIERAHLWAQQLREVLPGQSIEDLASLMPGSTNSPLHRNYKEGLRMAGLH